MKKLSVQKKTLGFALAALAMTRVLAVHAQNATPVLTPRGGTGSALNLTTSPAKKLLEYGWDVPSPQFLRDNLKTMQSQPFDGIIFRLADHGGEVFDVSKWDEAKLRPQLKTLSGLPWGRFTDNFLTLYAASTMDWTSESDWQRVLAHVRFAARAAKIAGCKGIMFDPEPYGNNPWNYVEQKHAATMSYDAYQALTRRRGRQFMMAIQSEMPGVKILMLHGLTLLLHSNSDADPVKREAALKSHPYALMIGFTNGMLDVADPNAQIIDGNEAPSYYYQSTAPFFQSYHEMRQTAKLLVSKEDQAKYDRNGRASQALYVDYVFNTRPDIMKNSPAIYMTPQQRAQWFEHNTYYALQASDEYAWLYSEKMNWWTNTGLPEGIRQAVINARDKVRTGQKLDFDIDALMKNARDARTAAINEKLVRRSATVPKIAAAQAPKIDGVLDDALYQTLTPQPDFVGYFNEPAPPTATTSWLAYDDENLYVAMRCAEPKTKDLHIVGENRDDAVWNGDSVEVSLANAPENGASLARDASYFHFIVNPRGVLWDARARGESNDISFNSNAKSAAKIGADQWTVEVAIPWKDLGMTAPQPGTKLSLNLARVRVAGESATYSSWSQFVGGFQETENFGTVTRG